MGLIHEIHPEVQRSNFNILPAFFIQKRTHYDVICILIQENQLKPPPDKNFQHSIPGSENEEAFATSR